MATYGNYDISQPNICQHVTLATMTYPNPARKILFEVALDIGGGGGGRRVQRRAAGAGGGSVWRRRFGKIGKCQFGKNLGAKCQIWQKYLGNVTLVNLMCHMSDWERHFPKCLSTESVLVRDPLCSGRRLKVTTWRCIWTGPAPMARWQLG
jgi:hypothetical protein